MSQMKRKVQAGAIPDTYLALVKRHPLTSIRSEKDFAEAQAVADDLLREELDDGKQAYLDTLSDLMIIYEQEHHAVAPATSPRITGPDAGGARHVTSGAGPTGWSRQGHGK